MKRLLLLVAAVSCLVVMTFSCIKTDPLYCDESTPCEKGKKCNLGNHTCEPAADGGRDTGPGDVKIADKKPPDLKAPDVKAPDGPVPDTGPDTTVDSKTDLPPTDLPQPDLGPVCPNGKREGTEQCDGTDFGGMTCQKLGFQCGPLKCQSNCTLDKSGCDKGWAAALPGTIEAISGDDLGNVYVTGTFTAPATFGTKTTLSGSNLFVAKLDSAGMVSWAVAPAGNASAVNAIVSDNSGNSFLTGTISGKTITFGLNTVKHQGGCGTEAWIVKLKKDGMFDWVTYIGGANSSCDDGTGLALDATGNLYISGFFGKGMFGKGETEFGTLSRIANGDSDAFVAKLDSLTGQFSSVFTTKSSATSDLVIPRGIQVDKAKNIYLVGEYWGSVELDYSVGLSTSKQEDLFIAKYNASGKPLWITGAGSSTTETATGIAVDGLGNIHIYGTSSTGAKFGTTTLNSGFTAKLNGNGTFTWAVPAVGTAAAVAKGTPYLIGSYSGSKTFGTKAHKASGGTDVFVARLDTSSGKYLAAVSGGGTGSDTSADLHADGSGNLYATGSFSGTATFGSTTLTSGKSFVWRIPACALP